MADEVGRRLILTSICRWLRQELSGLSVKTVCFIPCCSTKNAVGGTESLPYAWPDAGLKTAWNNLQSARHGNEHSIKFSSQLTPALYLYSGAFYHAFDPEPVKQAVHKGQLRLFILSAGYGLLDAFEPVFDYDAEMKGKVARYWRDSGLVNIISDICLALNPEQIYGFFAGEPAWSGAGAKYRYFFTEGVKKAVQSGIKPARAGCFYRQSGRGVTAILKSLGRVFAGCLASNFTCDGMIAAVGLGGLKEGNIVIGYDDLTMCL